MTPPYFLAIIEKILQKVILFFSEREEKIKPWFWHVWIAQWLTFFCNTYFFFRCSPSSGGNAGSNLDQMCSLWGRSFSIKTRIFQTIFFSARLLFLVRILIILDHIWGSRGPKITAKGHFVHAEPVSKALKIFDWTTTNAILMKLTTVM